MSGCLVQGRSRGTRVAVGWQRLRQGAGGQGDRKETCAAGSRGAHPSVWAGRVSGLTAAAVCAACCTACTAAVRSALHHQQQQQCTILRGQVAWQAGRQAGRRLSQCAGASSAQCASCKQSAVWKLTVAAPRAPRMRATAAAAGGAAPAWAPAAPLPPPRGRGARLRRWQTEPVHSRACGAAQS